MKLTICVKNGVLLCTLSLTQLVRCNLVVIVTFEHINSIHDNQCLTHQVHYIIQVLSVLWSMA